MYTEVISSELPLLLSSPFTRNMREPSMCVHICLKSKHLTILKTSSSDTWRGKKERAQADNLLRALLFYFVLF